VLVSWQGCSAPRGLEDVLHVEGVLAGLWFRR
jgi:hypothetical protein